MFAPKYYCMEGFSYQRIMFRNFCFPLWRIYGMDIFVKTDDAENAVELIKEIRNQEKQ